MSSGTIDIISFGIACDLIGSRKIVFDWKGSQSVGNVKEALIRKYPQLSEIRTIKFAVNGEYAEDDQLVTEGDEIAIIPPVSGG